MFGNKMVFATYKCFNQSLVETENAAYESFDGMNEKHESQQSASTSAQVPIYAMPDKRKPADNVGDLYARVNKKSKKGNVFLFKLALFVQTLYVTIKLFNS